MEILKILVKTGRSERNWNFKISKLFVAVKSVQELENLTLNSETTLSEARFSYKLGYGSKISPVFLSSKMLSKVPLETASLGDFKKVLQDT